MKKRKLSYLELPKDVWTLISQQCEWPEASALRMVCKAANEGISLNVINTKFKQWILNDIQLDWSKLIIYSPNRRKRVPRFHGKVGIYWISGILKNDIYECIGYTCIRRFARSHNYIK